MNKPSVVVFDLGKVLVDFDYSISAKKFAAQASKTPEQIKELIDHSPLLFEFEHGRLTKEEFYKKVCEVTGFCGKFEDFCDFFSKIFEPIPPMLELNEKLRANRIPTFIFSNTNELAVRHIRDDYPFFRNFDGFVLSYEEGVMKPHRRIYEKVETVTGKKGADIVYIDDRLENVATGTEMGWKAIQHHHPTTTIKKLQELGLPV